MTSPRLQGESEVEGGLCSLSVIAALVAFSLLGTAADTHDLKEEKLLHVFSPWSAARQEDMAGRSDGGELLTLW